MVYLDITEEEAHDLLGLSGQCVGKTSEPHLLRHLHRSQRHGPGLPMAESVAAYSLLGWISAVGRRGNRKESEIKKFNNN